jgi:glycosyltransferase involved in cell wall biosynthesis
MANALVQPGNDSWGLVVNEAAACGVPAVVSDHVGCAPDLIVSGETGFIFKRDSVDELAKCMFELRRLVLENSLSVTRALSEKCDEYSQEVATRGLQRALNRIVSNHGTMRGSSEPPIVPASLSTSDRANYSQPPGKGVC